MLALLTALILNLGSGPADREHHASFHPLMQCMVVHIAEMVEEDGDQVQRTRLMIRDLDGSNARILHAPEGENAQEPRWSPNGDWIAFVGGPDYEIGRHSLYVIRPDGSDLRRVAGAEDGLIKSPYWTADSQALVFEVRHFEAGYTHIDRIELATGDRERLTHDLPGHHQHPRISPDGTQLLVSWRDPATGRQTGDLFVHALDRPQHRTRITHTPDIENMPAWSPEGGFIVYSRAVETGGYELFAVEIATGHEIRLTDTPDVMEFFPAFMPDGSGLTYDRFTMSETGPRSAIAQLALAEADLVTRFAASAGERR